MRPSDRHRLNTLASNGKPDQEIARDAEMAQQLGWVSQ